MKHPLNDVVWAKIAPSKIEGLGVFAIRDIRAGTELFGGENEYTRKNEEYILPVIMGLVRDHHATVEFWDRVPNPNRDIWMQCFMNHADDANSDGRYALKDIKEAEEITEDYRICNMGHEALKHFAFLNV